MLGPQAHRLGLVLMHVKERDRDRKQERLRETETEQEERERMELFSIIQPAPFRVQRSTSGPAAWHSLSGALQDTEARLAQAGLPGGAGPSTSGHPSARSGASRSYLSRAVPSPMSSTNRILPCKAGRWAPCSFRAAACLPFNLVLRCYGYKLQRFGRLLRESKFYSRERK